MSVTDQRSRQTKKMFFAVHRNKSQTTNTPQGERGQSYKKIRAYRTKMQTKERVKCWQKK